MSNHTEMLCDLIKATSWQPIETAPKDGTVILLMGPSGYANIPYRAHVGYWQNYVMRPGGDWRNHSDDWFMDDGADATHWMPLPPPPAV